MAKREPRPEEPAPGLPSWITSFGDMTTNLLTFFVLLQSFAHTRDAALFYVGQGSFRRVIAGLGIPDLLLGKDDRVKNQFPRSFFVIKNESDEPGKKRILDPEDDEIRQAFEELTQQMRTQADDVHQVRVPSGSPVLTFPVLGAEPTQASKDKLLAFVRDLKELPAEHACIYVLATAPDAFGPDAQWAMSACRAEAVRRSLLEAMETEGLTGWTVQAWGTPQASEWARLRFGLTGQEACAGLAVAETE
jgi:hypothetical protein